MLFRIGISVFICPGSISIIGIAYAIFVTIKIIPVCGLFYIDGAVAALEFMLPQLGSEIVIFVLPGMVGIAIGICPVSISLITVFGSGIVGISSVSLS